MQLQGRIMKEELKDVGKGKDKDAAANEVYTQTIKLDMVDGIRGSVYFVPTGDQSFELGDIVTVTISAKQGKLALAPGTNRPRRGARAPAEPEPAGTEH